MNIKQPKLIKWLLLVLFFAVSITLKSNADTLHFFPTNGSSELSTSHVLSMAHDKTGYMWFATMQGLFRYDGYETRKYVPKGYLPRQYAGVSTVNVDGEGTVWIKLSIGSMCFYDTRNDCLSMSCDSLLRRRGISINTETMFIDDGGDIWSKEGTCLKYYSFGQNKLFTIKCNHDIRNIVSSNNYHYAIDGNGNIYKISETHLALLAKVPTNMNEEFVFSIDHSSTLWITQKHSGAAIWRVSTKDGSIQEKKEINKILPTDFVRDITDDGKGNIWFGTNCSGVIIYNKNTGEPFLIQKKREQLSLPSNHIERLLVCGNVMWIGTGQRGPSVVSLESSTMKHIPVDETEQITSVLEDNDGNMWVGFDGTGVRCIKKSGEQRNYSTANSNIPSNTIIGMFLNTGKVWMCSYGGGLFYFDGGKFVKDERVALHPQLAFCQTCFFDRKGDLWVSTFSNGVYRIHGNSIKKIPSLPTDNITAMAYSPKNNRIYIGTAIGVSCVEESGNVHNIIKDTHVTCLLVDHASHIWIGTTIGLDCVDANGKVIKTVTHNDDLASDYIRSLTLDKTSGIWVGCTDGLSHISLGRNGSIKSVRTFAHSDAQTQYNFYRNAVGSCNNGDVIFAGDGELLRMGKQTITGKGISPKVFFTSLHIGDIVKSVDNNDIKIKYSERKFSVSISNFNYDPDKNITYRYRLSADEAWTLTDGNIIAFNGLAYGDYDLEVQSKGITGEYGESSVLHISVLAPWYWSLLARIFYLLLFIICIIAYIIYIRKRYTRKMECQRVMLEKKGKQDIEDARMQILTNVIDEELLQKVSNAVNKNISNANYSVIDLSQELKMSHSGLYKKLMAITGKSPLEYMHLIRLKRGKEIIDGGETSISQVAYQVGLSPKQFSKYFKQVYGSLPSEYLTLLRKENEDNLS